MAIPPLQQQVAQAQMRYVDRIEVSETFADLLGRVFCDGITLRMEFSVNRMDDPVPGSESCRVASEVRTLNL